MPLTELESACLDDHRRGAGPPGIAADSGAEAWAAFGIRLALSSSASVRARRRVVGRDDVSHKDDGSPATEVEHAIEHRLRQWLAAAADVWVVGEETGGLLPADGTAVAIDPIDGTRAFLSETETYATALAVFRDGTPFVAVIASPVTGELAWSTTTDARLLRLSVFGEEPDSCSLGDHHPAVSRSPLVHLHPAQGGKEAMTGLYGAWRDGRVAMVRSPGGSPAWCMVEAARGHFAYVNLWGGAPAAPYDLAAGVFTVRAAGGDVVAADGRPIDPLGHQGPFIAAIDGETRDRVAALVRSSATG